MFLIDDFSANNNKKVVKAIHTAFLHLKNTKYNVIVKPSNINYGGKVKVLQNINYGITNPNGPSLIVYSTYCYDSKLSGKLGVEFLIEACHYQLTSEFYTKSKSEFEKYKLKNKLKQQMKTNKYKKIVG